MRKRRYKYLKCQVSETSRTGDGQVRRLNNKHVPQRKQERTAQKQNPPLLRPFPFWLHAKHFAFTVQYSLLLYMDAPNMSGLVQTWGEALVGTARALLYPFIMCIVVVSWY